MLAAQPAGKALVDPQHNPVWTALISPESATALIEFWRRTDAAGALVHDFTDRDARHPVPRRPLPGPLRAREEDLRAAADAGVRRGVHPRPDPDPGARRSSGCEGLKLIDPTCGSGHFLLGAFDRLLAQWTTRRRRSNVNERVRRALDSIHGVDLNPFAVAIARFRLTVAGLQAVGERSLVEDAPLGYHLAVGDSLLGEPGGVPAQLPFDEARTPTRRRRTSTPPRTSRSTRHPAARAVPRGGRQPAVHHGQGHGAQRGLPPGLHRPVTGKYALSVPFMELFFRLAIMGDAGAARRLRRADHRQLVHEARVRQEADRGLLSG